MEDQPTMISFASDLLRFYPEQRIVVADGYRYHLAEKQHQVLEPLAYNIGQTVLTEDLIDITKPDLVDRVERYRQRLKVQSYILGLRTTFNRMIDGLGNPETGVIQTEFGVGYTLSESWPLYKNQ